MGTLADVQVVDNSSDVLAAQLNALLGSIARGDYSNATTMSGTVTLTDGDYAIQRFNCNGANRIVKLPAQAAANHLQIIFNTTAATYTLDVQSNAGVSLLPLPLEALTGWAVLVPDGSTGFRLIASSVGLPETFEIGSIISPAQITSNQNDYSPTGLSTCNVLRLSTDASRDITGLAGGASGRIIIVHNVGAQNIVLKDESGSSSAANRFALTADATLTPDTVVLLHYDATSSRWRLVGGGGGGTWGSITGTLSAQTDLITGWIDIPFACVYSSVDSPTSILSVPGDITGMIGLGDRITFSQATGGTKWFIVTVVGAYSGGNTLITMYGGTHSAITNETVTSPKYSHQKHPFGFPPNPTSWTTIAVDNGNANVDPTANTWYGGAGLSPTGVSIVIPIGVWRVNIKAVIETTQGATAAAGFRATFSTANNSESDATFTQMWVGQVASGLARGMYIVANKILAIAVKTTYYIDILAGNTDQTTLAMRGDVASTSIYLECAYL